MDAARITPPRRLAVPIENRWGAGEMAVLDFGDPKRPVDLIFLHANGFNASTYRALLAPLAGAMRIWAPDLRGHGRTTLPTGTKGRWSWADHRDDLVALIDSLDGPPMALAGHSMGGTTALLAAAERPERVSSLVLLDPVIWSRPMVLALGSPLFRWTAGRIPLVKNALKRRTTFDSRETALKAYRGRGAFKGWPETMVADYVAEGFHDAEDGVTLACTPQWEAANYAAQSHDPWQAMKRLGRPVRILKGETNSTCAVQPNPRGLPGVRVETVAGGTHFFPMTHADVARDALFEARASLSA